MSRHDGIEMRMAELDLLKSAPWASKTLSMRKGTLTPKFVHRSLSLANSGDAMSSSVTDQILEASGLVALRMLVG